MMKNKRKNLLILLFLMFITVLVIGVSYALLTKNIIGGNNKVVYKVGDLEVKLDESGSKDISLTNAMPEEDSEGLTTEPYSFSIVNNATTDLKYTIYLEDDTDAKNSCGTNCELVPYNFVKYNLSSDSTSLKTNNLSSSSTELYTGTITSKSTDKFNLRVWLSIDADNTAMNKYYFGKIKVVINQGDDYCIRNGFNTLSDCMLVMNNHETSVETAKQNITNKGTPDFSKTATTDEGLYMAEDDEGASYYYRGSVKNNYVSFAGFIWRIIRRNGDGSIRMIYSGKKTSDTASDATIGYIQYSSKSFAPTYVGYKYSEKFILHENNNLISYNWFTNTYNYSFSTAYTFDTSANKFVLTGTVKKLTWKDNHDEIVAKNLYSCLNSSCEIIYKITGYYSDTLMQVQPITYNVENYQDTLLNDVNSKIKTVVDKWYKNNIINYSAYLADEIFCNNRDLLSGDGYKEDRHTLYKTLGNLESNKTPTLKCSNEVNKFSVKNEVAKLDYPVALITADEVAMAGGVVDKTNSEYYLYNNQDYWTMSPSYFSDGVARITFVFNTGSLITYCGITDHGGARPVINLKSDVKISSGDGTSIAPYKIK